MRMPAATYTATPALATLDTATMPTRTRFSQDALVACAVLGRRRTRLHVSPSIFSEAAVHICIASSASSASSSSSSLIGSSSTDLASPSALSSQSIFWVFHLGDVAGFPPGRRSWQCRHCPRRHLPQPAGEPGPPWPLPYGTNGGGPMLDRAPRGCLPWPL